MKRQSPLIILAAALLLLTSCSSENAAADYAPMVTDNYAAVTEAAYAYDKDIAVEAEREYGISSEPASYDKSGTRQSSIADTRKIIKNVSLALETMAFDSAVEQIRSSCVAAGGYMEYSYVSGESIRSSGAERYASFTVRVPAAGLDAYCDSLGGTTFNVLSRSENSFDITDTYYDTEARLKSLQTQEERLLSMLEGATELEYMLQIENTLADVRYQIESYYSTIKSYDSQVALSTVTIELREVIEYQPEKVVAKTFGERVADAFTKTWVNFGKSCQNFAVNFIWQLPTLLIWAAVIAAAALIVRAVIKKRRDKKRDKE